MSSCFASYGIEAEKIADSNEERSRKVSKINEIKTAGFGPEIWIFRHGMKTKAEYTAVEATAIDLLHSFLLQRQHDARVRIPEQHMEQLTNARREAASGQGIRLLDDIIDGKAVPPLTAKIPLLLITLKLWVQFKEKEEITGGELRDGYGYKPEWLTSSVRTENLEEIGKAVSAWWLVNVARIHKEGI